MDNNLVGGINNILQGNTTAGVSALGQAAQDALQNKNPDVAKYVNPLINAAAPLVSAGINRIGQMLPSNNRPG